MRFRILLFALGWLGLCSPQAYAAAPAVRLALVVQDESMARAADTLTVELSKRPDVHVLEREEIERVYHEQALSAGSRDYLKLGQILGADGLLLLGAAEENGTNWLRIELLAVKPGVLLLSEQFGWPLKDPAEWAAGMSKHLDPLLPKLSVLPRDALPISVINLRSAINSSESTELERQLTLLLTRQLSRQKELFVLERRRMQLMAGEKELRGLDDSAFWNGGYLLDGVLDRNGFSPDIARISVQLKPPQGREPLRFEVSGSRTNYAQLARELVASTLQALKQSQPVQSWTAPEEAEEYYAEAQWAFKWGLFPQAQAAAESAWALGKHTPETAILRLRTYSQSTPPYWSWPATEVRNEEHFRRNLTVATVPDSSEFQVLGRALELLRQDRAELLGARETSRTGFLLALQLLRRTAALLESYYYAAPARADQEQPLAQLRERMRQSMEEQDLYPAPPAPALINPPNDPAKDYAWLKWEEGSLCLERPEAALPMLRQVLAGGYQPERLPRLAGWSWEDRKRIPCLMNQFVDGLCHDTNAWIRIEGFYLALLKAPLGRDGCLEKSEADLLAALWENRVLLFSHQDRAGPWRIVTDSFRSGYDNHDSYGPYTREPFAGFRQRLFVDFLQHASEADLPAFAELFRWSNNFSDETPEQARELELFVRAYQQRISSPAKLDSGIAFLHKLAAGVRDPAAPAKPAAPAMDVLGVKFVPWRLRQPGIDAERSATFHAMKLRQGKLWVLAYYPKFENGGFATVDESRFSFLAVDPQTGADEEIPFPPDVGTRPPSSYEVGSEALFVCVQQHLYRFRFKERAWDEIPAPLQKAQDMLLIGDRLYLSTQDGLLEISPGQKTTSVLVSARRQPPENEIDPIWSTNALLFSRPGGQLGALVDGASLSLDSWSRKWTIKARPDALPRAIMGTHLITNYASEGGALELLYALGDRYLAGYWSDGSPAEILLVEPDPFDRLKPSEPHSPLPSRWHWSKGIPMDWCRFDAQANSLWVLCPCMQSYAGTTQPPREPVAYPDDRKATILRFEPEFREPLSLAIAPEAPPQTSKPSDAFQDHTPASFERAISPHLSQEVFWIKTEGGLVIGANSCCGHWWLPNAAFEEKLQAQRQTFRQPSAAHEPKPAQSSQP